MFILFLLMFLLTHSQPDLARASHDVVLAMIGVLACIPKVSFISMFFAALFVRRYLRDRHHRPEHAQDSLLHAAHALILGLAHFFVG